MECVREIEITINDEKFDDTGEALQQLELLSKNDNHGNDIEIYIDTNKVTYEKDCTIASDAINYIKFVMLEIR